MYIYVASPYSDPDPDVRADRYFRVLKHTAELIAEGRPAYSPIVHFHDMAIRHDLPYDFHFWKRVNASMIQGCEELHVLRLPGWEESKGVAFEIEFAALLRKPILRVGL